MTIKGVALHRQDGVGQIILHAEAFHLMRYANRATGHREWLWNSRDGVTPFGINDPAAPAAKVEAWREASKGATKVENYGQWLKDNPDPSTMLHEAWGEDSFVPNFVPPLGMRIFMSWSDVLDSERERTRQKWAKRLADYEKQGLDPSAELRSGEPFGFRPTDPVVCVVDEELQALFEHLCADNPFVQPRRPPLGPREVQGHG